MQNLTTHVLGLLDNWNTSNYSPKPALVNQNDSAFYSNPPTGFSVGDSTKEFDHTDATVIKVGSQPERSSDPIGTEFDLRVDDAVQVTIQAVPTRAHGDVADHNEFRTQVVEEARRLIDTDRSWPIRNQAGDEHWFSLYFGPEADNSANYRDFYEYQFDVEFDGHEELS